jgi:hypothetical protein
MIEKGQKKIGLLKAFESKFQILAIEENSMASLFYDTGEEVKV